MYLSTLSPKVSRLKNELYNDALEASNGELWAAAQRAVKVRAEAAAEIATDELMKLNRRAYRAEIFNKFLREYLELENTLLRQYGSENYLNHGQ